MRSLPIILLLSACSDPAHEPAPDALDPLPDAVPVDVPDPQPRCVTPFPDRQWGTAGDDLAAVTISPTGGVFVHGYTDGDLTATSPPGGGAHGYLERLGRWSTAIGNSVDVVAVGANDELVVAGRTFESGQADLLVGDVTTLGVAQKLERAGVAPSERPFELLVDGDRRFVIGQHDLYVPSNYVDSWEDPFVFQWNASTGAASGTFARARTARPDFATGAALGADGVPIVTGGALDGYGSFITRVNGAFAARSWGYSGPFETVRSIRRLPDGDFMIAGTTMRLLGARAFGDEDVYVARLAPDLVTIRWITQLGSEVGDLAVDLVVDATGKSWLLGETAGDVGGLPAGRSDLFVVALDAHGDERWERPRGSSEDERPTRLAVDACETVIVAGATSGALVPGATPRGYDAFVITIDHTTPE